jgi:transposase-like protein
VLLGLSPSIKEDTESCRAFLQDLRRRGLKDPLLTVTDGAPGLIRAVEECLPRSLRQRCLAHRMRNLESKVPEQSWPELRARARACYEAPSTEMARALATDFERSPECSRIAAPRPSVSCCASVIQVRKRGSSSPWERGQTHER